MSYFAVEILAANKVFYRGEMESLTLPLVDGMYGIRAGHVNMISAVVPGVLKCRLRDGTPKTAAVSIGILKIEEGKVILLLETVEEISQESTALPEEETKGESE